MTVDVRYFLPSASHFDNPAILSSDDSELRVQAKTKSCHTYLSYLPGHPHRSPKTMPFYLVSRLPSQTKNLKLHLSGANRKNSVKKMNRLLHGSQLLPGAPASLHRISFRRNHPCISSLPYRMRISRLRILPS